MTDKIDIAVGMSAESRTWKNKQVTWEELKEKLTTEHKTNETFKAYMAASKSDQLKIKDVGGFVGGFLRKGRRKPENVAHRQIITLDIDEGRSDFWLDFKMLYNNEAVLHGTHKYSPADPRYRLIMPLSRECAPDEYVAIARYVAGTLGIELFDNTTFQPERLMFWPSSPKDIKYYCKTQTGPWLDADGILDSYTDWTDVSSWPTSEEHIRELKDKSKKQEDPEAKKGVVGAFCKTYDVHQAIEKFLSDVYVPAGDNRYTYTRGSATAGVVVYEDKFVYSHHGTDPIGGTLCNSFDLVRVNLFGHLDTTATGIKAKSFQAMVDLAREDKEVRKVIAAEKIDVTGYMSPSAEDDFSDDLELTEEEINLDWASDLKIDKNGAYISSATNLNLIFKNDVLLKGKFKENLFDSKKYVMASVPWRRLKEPEPLKNVDLSGIRNYIEHTYGITSVGKIEDALNLEFERNSFHPIRDYLNGLEWDGKSRIDHLLIDYFGADDNIYSREAIRKPIVAAVARVFNPGVKFDLVLVLAGDKQGTGKSTFISKLGLERWFSDSFHTINGKEAFEQLQGAWIMELAELSGVRKFEIEAVKHFITKREDTYRPAYGRMIETFKRQVVFIGTSNQKDFLQDPTGNRRFMPVDVIEERIKKSSLSPKNLVGEEINQIWAEAMELYKRKEPLYLSSEAEKIAQIEQMSHSIIDSRQGVILEFLETELPDDWKGLDIYERRGFLNDPLSKKGTETRQFVCVAEIWCECLGKEKHEMTRYNTKEVNDIMRGLPDWDHVKSTKNFPIYGKQKYYIRKLN